MASERQRRPVLMVEDDPDIREALIEVLQSHGFEMVAASTGPEALERLAQMERPPLVLLDAYGPTLDGAEFLARLRADPKLSTCKVVFMKAGPGAPPPGADAVFGRLFEISDLIALLSRHSPPD